MMKCRGIRGATTAQANTEEAIIAATVELLEAMIEANGLEEEDIASAIFTTTPDLNTAYPASASRKVGWWQTAVIGCQEIDKPGGMARAIRVLLHWNTVKPKDEIVHIYLRGAEKLRPDLQKHNKTHLNGSEA